MALTIGLKGMFGLCIFDSPCSLGGRGFVSLNVDLILLEMLLFSTWMFSAIILVGSLSNFLYFFLYSREGSSSFS